MLSPLTNLAVEPGNYAAGLGDAEFDFIRHVIGDNAGIVLGPNKRHLVQARLARRLRQLGLNSYEEYCNHVRESGPEELVGLINALTTNVTAFFRENHHFEALKSHMIPEAMQRNATSRRLRIWSAGCSTGEEPYCMAMIAAETLPASQSLSRGWDMRILATDIDSDVVATAQRGVYPQDRLVGVSLPRLQRFFSKGCGAQTGNAMVKPRVASLITFRTLNLLHPWPMRGPFDVIFCRNVMIYFNQATRESMVKRFSDLLAPGGYLCIGHSESIHANSVPLRLVGKTIYRRVGSAHAK